MLHALKVVVLMSLVCLIGACATQPSTPTLQLNIARFGHAVVDDGRYIYTIGGSNGQGFLNSFEVHDPKTGVSWVITDKLIPRRYGAAVWDGNESIYVLGGVSVENNRAKLEKRVEVINTRTLDVSFAPDLPMPRRRVSAVFLRNTLFVLGGTLPVPGKPTLLKPSDQVQVFSTKRQRWFKGPEMPTAKATRAIAANNKIYTVGGYDGKQALQEVTEFDLSKRSWRTLSPLPFATSAHSLVVKDSKIIVLGDYTRMNRIQVYDTATDSWILPTQTISPRRHAGAVTIDGVIYAVGGIVGPNGPSLQSIEPIILDKNALHAPI